MKKRLSKLNAWLHLWLGIVTGIPVVLISLTGCVLVFEQEIRMWTTDYIAVEEKTADEQLPPSVLYKSIKQAFPEKEAESFWYNGLNKSVKVSLHDSDSILYVNPYNAEVLATAHHEDFFHFIDEGHRHLWFPGKIGKKVVGYSTLIFFSLLITGIILWWPKKWNKRSAKQSFFINWKARFKRINYDLHNVLGFYSLLLALLMSLTGLVMSFPWMRQSIVWLSGGYPPRPKTEVKKTDEEQKITFSHAEDLQKVDKIWFTVRKEIALHNKEAVIIHIPEGDDKTIYSCTDMHAGSWRDLSFDRETLALTPRTQKKMEDSNRTEWLMRNNYALHTGFIGGMTTKILYFLASLICASLPITGFYIWWGKKSKKTTTRNNRRGTSNKRTKTVLQAT